MDSDSATLVPPRRLGTLLRQARVAAGVELADLAVGAGITVVELEDIEHGRRYVDDGLLRQLVVLYGIEGAGLVPVRSQLVIDLDEGRIAVDESDITVGELSGPDAVLARYLALVYRLRGLQLGTPISLRDIDLDVLSNALEIESGEVESRLRRLMADEDRIAADQKRIRRRFLLPIVGVVIAACSTGTLVLIAESDDAPAPTTIATATMVDAPGAQLASAAVADTAVETDIGNGGAIETAPGVATELGSPAVETNAEG